MSDHASSPIRISTRGSALALAQAGWVRDTLEVLFPDRQFELKIIRTSGDRQSASGPMNPGSAQPRGLFTKELEAALLAGEADLAVHSLKDLPTELADGLVLAGTPPRADVREVLLYRGQTLRPVSDPAAEDWGPGRRSPFYGERGVSLKSLPRGAILGTSSTRRAAAIRSLRPDIEIVPFRGNVGTRLQKLRDPAVDATLLAAAGLVRLNLDISPKGELRVDPRLPAAVRAGVEPPPEGLQAVLMEPEEFLPAVGQGALGLEARAEDAESRAFCMALNHANTLTAVTAERALLNALGGGCQTPLAALGRVLGHQVHLDAVWYRDDGARRVRGSRPVREASTLGELLAAELQKA